MSWFLTALVWALGGVVVALAAIGLYLMIGISRNWPWR